MKHEQKEQELTRTGSTKVRVFRQTPETTGQQAEPVQVFNTKQERLRQSSQERAERLEIWSYNNDNNNNNITLFKQDKKRFQLI